MNIYNRQLEIIILYNNNNSSYALSFLYTKQFIRE
jgi:hypothetical protein